MTTQGTTTPSLPSKAEAALAKETGRILAARRRPSGPLRFRLLDEPSVGTIKLPAAAVNLLVRVLEEMGSGNAVTLTPVRAELTTQEAADLLNISRPSLIQLLDEGKIAYRRVGTHRRVRFDALIAYQRHATEQRRAALAELAAYDQLIGS